MVGWMDEWTNEWNKLYVVCCMLCCMLYVTCHMLHVVCSTYQEFVDRARALHRGEHVHASHHDISGFIWRDKKLVPHPHPPPYNSVHPHPHPTSTPSQPRLLLRNIVTTWMVSIDLHPCYHVTSVILKHASGGCVCCGICLTCRSWMHISCLDTPSFSSSSSIH